MKTKRLLIALLCLLIPIAARGIWYYRGFPSRPQQINSPDYQKILITHPTLSTPAVEIDSLIDSNELQKRVIFDLSHRNQFTYDEVEALRNNLIWRNVEVISSEDGHDLTSQLTKADAFVILAPTSYFELYEIEAIEEFVDRGGRLLVVADPTRSFSEYEEGREESVILTNEILQPFRLSFRNDYVYNLQKNEGNFRNIFVQSAENHPLNNEIEELVFYASHSLDNRTKTVFSAGPGAQSSLEDREETVSVASVDKSGNVLAIGDMTFITTPYNQIADNDLLIKNIADFLINGDRQIQISDFPNLFRQNIGIILGENLQLEPDLISVISDIKDQYAQDDLEVEILEAEQENYDLIYLGIYPPEGDLDEFAGKLGILFDIGPSGDPLSLTPIPTPTKIFTTTPEVNDFEEAGGIFPSDDETIDSRTLIEDSQTYIPGIGNIPEGKFGIIAIKQEENQNNILFLSSDEDNAADLLALLLDDSLFGCLSTDLIAICEQDSFSYSSDYPDEEPTDPNWEELSEESDLLLDEVTPTPTHSVSPEPDQDSF